MLGAERCGDGAVELYLYWTLDAKADDAVTVRGSDGHTVTCSVPAGTNLAAFGVGTSVKMHCHKLGGQFRLDYLKSEGAVIEIGALAAKVPARRGPVGRSLAPATYFESAKVSRLSPTV